MAEVDLPAYRLDPWASLVTFTKRPVCTQCGSGAVAAYAGSDKTGFRHRTTARHLRRAKPPSPASFSSSLQPNGRPPR